MKPHVLPLKLKYFNADSISGVEILLYGKRPSPASRVGTVPGEKEDQDGYVTPEIVLPGTYRVITSSLQIPVAYRMFRNGGR